MRQVIPQALELIKRTEKCSLKPYHGEADGETVLTIGYGHAIQPGEKDLMAGITQREADELFAEDVSRHSAYLDTDAGIHLDDWVFGCFASAAFNLGPRFLQTANSICAAFDAGRITAGILNLYKFSNSDGQYRDGLFYRRLTEIYLAITHQLVAKPDNCQQAKELMDKLGSLTSVKNLPEWTNLRGFFTVKHRRDLCSSCKCSSRR